MHPLNLGSSHSSEYTANLYKGCTHACSYCYAPSLIHDERQWGSYVDAKTNAPTILEKEVRKLEKHVVFLSSASDPYQPVEAKYRITRRVLEVLLKHEFPVLILTRSPLVLRDTDLLKNFPWVRVGFSISSVPDKICEPGVPSLQTRLRALKHLSDSGITTWVSLAPIIPRLMLVDMDRLFNELKNARVTTVVIGLLRFDGYKKSQAMFEEKVGRPAAYFSVGGKDVYREISNLAKRYGIDTTGSCLTWNGSKGSERSRKNDLLELMESHPTTTLDSFVC